MRKFGEDSALKLPRSFCNRYPKRCTRLLMDLLRRNRPQAEVARFVFRAVSPLFDTASFAVCGQPDDSGDTVRLWAKNATGGLAMDATATLR